MIESALAVEKRGGIEERERRDTKINNDKRGTDVGAQVEARRCTIAYINAPLCTLSAFPRNARYMSYISLCII